MEFAGGITYGSEVTTEEKITGEQGWLSALGWRKETRGSAALTVASNHDHPLCVDQTLLYLMVNLRVG